MLGCFCAKVHFLASDLRVSVEQSSLVVQGCAKRPKPVQLVPKSSGKCIEVICRCYLWMQAAIMGHSMGGHGALTIGLKNPTKYASISAFAPISNPTNVPWGQKAFKGYLGDDKSEWSQYDATELAKAYDGPKVDILIDQGTSDNFLKEQLDPAAFKSAAEGNSKLNLQLRLQASCLDTWLIHQSHTLFSSIPLL